MVQMRVLLGYCPRPPQAVKQEVSTKGARLTVLTRTYSEIPPKPSGKAYVSNLLATVKPLC